MAPPGSHARHASVTMATASTREVGRVKRKLYGAGVAVGAFMMVTGTVLSVPADVAAQAQPGDAAESGEAAQQAQPAAETAQQAQPSPAAKPAAAPAQAPAAKPATAPAPAQAPAAKPATSPAAKPAGTPATAPRAGGFPVELAMPLVAGGGAVASAGVFMLRRGRRKG